MIFYGRNVVIEALKSNFKALNVYLQDTLQHDTNEKIQEITSLAKRYSIPIKYISLKELHSYSPETQGVAIELSFMTNSFKDIDLDNFNQAYMYISTATYEHNIGAIIRTAEVAGFNGVILPKHAQITPTVAKVSTGALFHIPIFQESIFNSIKFFKQHGFQVAGIEREGRPYYESYLTENTLFIIGGEDKSLSDAVRNKSDVILEIPQSGKVNSLNMSVAAAIVMFERVRQLNS